MKRLLWVFAVIVLFGGTCLIGCLSPTKAAFLSVDQTLCVGCGQCIKVCKYDAITIIGKKAVIDPSKCQQCGRCVKVCPYDAIQ
jgi:heterodisulfide reductase subunit A-like polyferredoxin